jgi:hypothetical protein
MSDITDVANTLCEMIVAIVYPNGVNAPPVLNAPVKVYPGWPDPNTLQGDLATIGNPGQPSALHISVFTTPAERNTTRYQPKEALISFNDATYTLAKTGQVITVGGSAPATFFAQNIAVFVNGLPYVTGATAGQTPAQIAAALQALIVAKVPGATVSGSTITLPAGARIGPLRVGGSGTTAKEVRRTEKLFQIGLWADSPANRAAMASLIDPVLSDTPFIALPDGYAARLRYKSTVDNDLDQKQGIYRRDLFYTVEFATTRAQSAYQAVVIETNLDDEFGDVIETSYS